MNSADQLLAAAERDPPSQVLPRALRAAVAAQRDDLAEWVRLELVGYHSGNPAMREGVVVPEYRGVTGHWRDDFGRLLALDDPELSFINEIRLPKGIAELEGMATAAGFLAVRDTDHAQLIRQMLKVEVSTFVFAASTVAQVVANIRAQLLDRLSDERTSLAGVDVSALSPPSAEIVQLKPSLYGVGVDLKALWRKWTTKRPDE